MNDEVQTTTDVNGSVTTVGTNNASRLAMLERINDGIDGVRGGEFRDIVNADTGETADFIGGDPEAAERAAEQADLEAAQARADAELAAAAAGEEVEAEEAPQKPAARQAPEMDENALVTRVVNGRQVTKTLGQWLATAAKVESADEYLATAKTQVVPREEEQPEQPSAEDVARQRDEEDLRIVQALQMGTPDEALAALRALRASQAPSSDGLKQQLVQQAATAAVERINQKKALEKFATDYPEIWNDPFLKGIAEERDRQLMDPSNPDHVSDYQDRYDKVGGWIRGWVGQVASQAGFTPGDTPAQPQAASSGKRLERKASLPQAPRAASAKPAGPAPDEPEESEQDVIRKMAMARGGPQWMMGQPKTS